MTWLVERQRRDDTWSPVDRYLTPEQARAVARVLSWRVNVWHRARIDVKGTTT